MKSFLFLAAAAFCFAALVAIVVLQPGDKADVDRARTLDFFHSERPPTDGGQEMKPRWGE